MMSYETAIEHALNHAQQVYLDEVTDDDGYYDHLKDVPDDTPVNWNAGASVTSEGSRIIVPSLDELSVLQRQMAAHLGYRDMGAIDAITRHEGEHAVAAHILGAKRNVFGIQVLRVYTSLFSPEHTIGWKAFNRATDLASTKLGVAAMKAHPYEPSPGDLQEIEALNYDVDEIGFKAVAHNREHTDKIPVPLSYKSNAQVHIPLRINP